MTDQPKCANCRFFDADMTECHRRAPRTYDETKWPWTTPEEWCGEHESVPAPPAPPKVFMVAGKPMAEATNQEINDAWNHGAWRGVDSVDLLLALRAEMRRRKLLKARPSE